MSRKASLGELIGKSADKSSIEMDDLGELLGERMPELEFSPRGRLRLVMALRDRFGANFKNIKGLSGLMKKFDKEVEFSVKVQEMKMIKGKK